MLENDKILATRLVASTAVTQLNQVFRWIECDFLYLLVETLARTYKIISQSNSFSVFSKYNDIEFLFVENTSRPSKTMLAKWRRQ